MNKTGNVCPIPVIDILPQIERERLLFTKGQNDNKNKIYVCPSYLKSYRKESQLEEHLNNGCIIHVQKVDIPNKTNAKDHVKFVKIRRMFKK